jgi:hypothetical protein
MDDDCMIHSFNGPAVISDNGRRKEWWVNGQLHRVGGPTIIHKVNNHYNQEEWWIDGRKHRVDGPAVITRCSNGSWLHEWWIDGRKHRVDGPAVIKFEIKRENHKNKNKVKKIKTEEWWLDGQRHNKDGPAVQKTSICVDARWWVEGKENCNNKDEEIQSYVSYMNNNTNNVVIEKLFSANSGMMY